MPIVDVPLYGQVEFPDSMSAEEINRAAKKLYDDKLASNQAASKAAFEANQPSLMGGFLSEAVKNTGRLGSALMNTAPGAETGMNTPEVGLLALATPGGKWEGFGSALANSPIANIASALKNKLYPSPEYIKGLQQSAGSKFDVLAEALNPKTINTATADPLIEQALQQKQLNNVTIPGPLRGYMNYDQMPTYEQGRIWASGAGQLSQRDVSGINRPMQRIVSQFARAMDESNRELAVNEGLGQLYDSAMKEWGLAQTAAEKAKVYRRAIATAGITAALGSGGYYAMKRGAASVLRDLLP